MITYERVAKRLSSRVKWSDGKLWEINEFSIYHDEYHSMFVVWDNKRKMGYVLSYVEMNHWINKLMMVRELWRIAEESANRAMVREGSKVRKEVGRYIRRNYTDERGVAKRVVKREKRKARLKLGKEVIDMKREEEPND